MQDCIQPIGTLPRSKDWESLSYAVGCPTPHPIRTSSRRFPVLLRSAGVASRRIQIGETGTEPGRVIASPRIGAQVGATRPMAIHVGSSKGRLKRTSGASPVEAVGGAGPFDDMIDRVVC